MKSRTRKLLSLLLATAMVFTMNTFAFGEELADVDSVIYEEDDDDLSTDTDADDKDKDDDDDGDDDDDFGDGQLWPTSLTEVKVLYDDSGMFSYKDGKPVTSVKVEGDVVTVAGVNVSDPLSMNKTERGKAVIRTIIEAGEQAKDTYLVNNKDVPVSKNSAKSYGIEGMLSPFSDYICYDVIDLSGGNYLFVEYYTRDWDRLGWVGDLADPIPVRQFTGQKIDFNNGKAKANKSKAPVITVGAALANFASGTFTKVPGVSVAKAKVDKNGKDASVSGETVLKDATKVYDGNQMTGKFEVYDVTGTVPTFTISVKAADKAKSQAKAIKTALKDKKYQFGISQKLVYVYTPDGASWDPYKRPWTISSDKVEFAYDGVDEEELEFYGPNNCSIFLSKFNGKKANIVSEYYAGKYYDNKLRPGKDYELKTDGQLGASNTAVAYIDKFMGNYVYSYKEGLYDDGFKLAFRQSPDNKKLLRGGIYRAAGDGFVHSVED